MKDLASLIDLTQCPRLIEKYKGIVTLPLDLPKFELDDAITFWQIWNEEVAPVARQHIDRGALGKDNPSLAFTQWDGLALYEDTSLISKAAWNTQVSNRLADSQSNYVSAIKELLPFSRVRSIRLWSANRTVAPHYDGNLPASLDGVMRFPTEIRIMLHDENPGPTFWLTEASKHQPQTEVPQDQRYYVSLPNETNTFAWNNEDYLHGADFDPQYRKILVVVKGWVDLERLEQLLDKSIKRYYNHTIRNNND